MSLCWIFFVAISHAHAQQDPTIVNTQYGQIKGEITSINRQFTTVPYAAPPLNEFRWSAPQPHQPWTPSILNTTSIPPGCPQNCTAPTPNICPKVISEDCLYLNIYTPLSNNYSHESWPTLVYIHGGSFLENYGYGIRMNATHFVNTTNTIVVQINYRLGAIGFFYDSTLDIYGNFGYLDQLFAIEWVHNNIANFGGNKSQIILYGESAGGNSAQLHILNETNTIIKGAIMESATPGIPIRNVKSWGNLPYEFAKYLGCESNISVIRLECLRNVSWELIVDQQMNADLITPQSNYTLFKLIEPWSPTVGTELLPDQPLFAFQKGTYNKNIPFINGINKGEAFIMFLPNEVVTYDSLQTALIQFVGYNDTIKIMNFYNLTKYNDIVIQSAQIFTDMWWKCPNRNITASVSKYIDVYQYHFNHSNSFNNVLYPNNKFCWNIPCHTSELWDVFYSPNAMKEQYNVTFMKNEAVLATQMQTYWSNFAKYSNPNHMNNDGLIEWEKYQLTKKVTMLFDVDQLNMITDVDQDVCNFWDSLGYDWLNGL
eukprot:94494_1